MIKKIKQFYILNKIYNKLQKGEGMGFINDNKTYLCAIIIAIANIAHYQGWIDADTLKLIIGLFGGAGLASLRHGVKKSGK